MTRIIAGAALRTFPIFAQHHSNIKMKRIIPAILMTAISLVFFSAFRSGGEELRLHLQKGQTYTESQNSQSVITEQVQGQTITVNLGLQSRIGFTVKDFSNGIYDLSVQYQSVSMHMTLPNGNMTFNSDSATADNAGSMILHELMGKSFEVQMTPAGRITNISGLDSIFSQMSASMTSVPEAQREQTFDQLKRQFGENSLKGSLQVFTAIYPDKPVKQGDTWNVNTTMTSTMATALSSAYTLDEIGNDYDKISGKTTITPLDSTVTVQMNGMSLQYDMHGNMSSNLSVDRKSGWLDDGNIEQDMEGVAHIQPSAMIPNGMDMPISIKSTTHISGK